MARAVLPSMNNADEDDGIAEADVAAMPNTSEAEKQETEVDKDMDDEITPSDPSICYDFWW